jgi:hypothetical protein
LRIAIGTRVTTIGRGMMTMRRVPIAIGTRRKPTGPRGDDVMSVWGAGKARGIHRMTAG